MVADRQEVAAAMNTQHAIEKILQNFTKEIMKVFSDSVVRAVAQVSNARPAPSLGNGGSPSARKPGMHKGTVQSKSPRGSKGGDAARKGAAKGSPSKTEALSEAIVAVLERAEKNLSAREIQQKLGLTTLDEGRFSYALGKLKKAGRVTQHGDRRTARYGLGTVMATKPIRGRKAKISESVQDANAPLEG